MFNIDVDDDGLFTILSKVLHTLDPDGEHSVDQRWVAFFEKCSAPNLLKIVECVLAIPVSNAFVEWVFSVMQNLWSEERNRMSSNLVKAKICIKFNFKMSCMEIYDFVVNSKPLLKAAKSNTKYIWKNK